MRLFWRAYLGLGAVRVLYSALGCLAALSFSTSIEMAAGKTGSMLVPSLTRRTARLFATVTSSRTAPGLSIDCGINGRDGLLLVSGPVLARSVRSSTYHVRSADGVSFALRAGLNTIDLAIRSVDDAMAGETVEIVVASALSFKGGSDPAVAWLWPATLWILYLPAYLLPGLILLIVVPATRRGDRSGG